MLVHLRYLRGAGLATVLLLGPGSGLTSATLIEFHPAKDATLYEDPSGSLSNGGDENFFAGRTGSNADGAVRRGLIAFDLRAIPVGSTINSASLRLHITKKPAGGDMTTVMSVHKLLDDWGEGAVNDPGDGGAGMPAGLGDATWLHQFRPNDLWTSPGADFVGQASAAAIAGSLFTDVIWESERLATDVQNWVDNSGSNFGWLIKGDEAALKTARRFASRTYPDLTERPLLTVVFTPPPTRFAGDADNDGDVDRRDVLIVLQNYGRVGTGTLPADFGDFNSDNRVSLGDMGVVQQHIGESRSAVSPAVIPEPRVSWLVLASVCYLSMVGRGFALPRASDRPRTTSPSRFSSLASTEFDASQ